MHIYSFYQIFKQNPDLKIIIPLIQRDYAQGRNTKNISRIRNKFLQVLKEAIINKPTVLDFIYGSFNNNIFTPLDGQQRLTTLFLLHYYAAIKESINYDDYKFL